MKTITMAEVLSNPDIELFEEATQFNDAIYVDTLTDNFYLLVD